VRGERLCPLFGLGELAAGSGGKGSRVCRVVRSRRGNAEVKEMGLLVDLFWLRGEAPSGAGKKAERGEWDSVWLKVNSGGSRLSFGQRAEKRR